MLSSERALPSCQGQSCQSSQIDTSPFRGTGPLVCRSAGLPELALFSPDYSAVQTSAAFPSLACNFCGSPGTPHQRTFPKQTTGGTKGRWQFQVAVFEPPWLVHRHSMPSVSSGEPVGRSTVEWTSTGSAEYSLIPWKGAQARVGASEALCTVQGITR